MTYKYKDPVELGYKKTKMSKSAHNKLFSNRKKRWFNKFEYYVKDDSFLMDRYTSKLGIIAIFFIFPFYLLMYGIANKDTWTEMLRLLGQKKTGSFSRDIIHKDSVDFKEVIKALQ